MARRQHRPRFSDPNVPPPGEVALTYGVGLQIADGPTLEVDFGTGHDQVARGDAAGGGASPITTQGDLVIGDALGAPARLAKGSAGKVLTAGASTLSWEDAPSPTVDLAAAERALRRWPATSDTLALWEMGGSSGDLTNTGSLGSLGNLTPGAGLVRDALHIASTIGRGVRCTAASDSSAAGGVGVVPTSGTAATLWAVFVITTSDSSKRTAVCLDADASWGAPWISMMLSLQNGALKGDFNVDGAYHSISASMGGTGAERFACLTYDGTDAKLYLDGKLVATGNYPGAISWSALASRHIGKNGGDAEYWGGDILRVGLENVAWSADEIAERWLRLRGDWIG